MGNNKKLLLSLTNTARLSNAAIRKYLSGTMEPGLRKTLERQLREYDAIEREAGHIASQRGWELPEPDPVRLLLRNTRIRSRLSRNSSDSQIAQALILESTNAMIRSLQLLHRTDNQDRRVNTLSQKLLDSQTALIHQMQHYL